MNRRFCSRVVLFRYGIIPDTVHTNEKNRGLTTSINNDTENSYQLREARICFGNTVRRRKDDTDLSKMWRVRHRRARSGLLSAESLEMRELRLVSQGCQCVAGSSSGPADRGAWKLRRNIEKGEYCCEEDITNPRCDEVGSMWLRQDTRDLGFYHVAFHAR